MTRRRTGIHQLYREDPLDADRRLWGRESHPVSRRGFLGGAGYAAMSAALGAAMNVRINLQEMAEDREAAALLERADHAVRATRNGAAKVAPRS